MAEGLLMNHCGGSELTRTELSQYQAPAATETWFPIAHGQVLDAVSDTLGGAGFLIQRERLSVSHEGHRFFGVLDLSTEVSEGVTLAVGLRNSTDKSFPIGFCCGSRVFVCDNLAFTSEIIVNKRHTRFGGDRYMEGMCTAVASLNQYKEATAQWIANLKSWELSEDKANSILLQSYEQEIIGARMLPQVIEEWRKPSHEEFQPRTGWSLWNCFTEVLGRKMQVTQPAAAAITTIRLQKILTPTELVA